MNQQSYWPDKEPSSPTILGQALPGALLGLPTEILILILRYLPVPDVLRVQSTCRLLDSIIRTWTVIQYKIELYCAWRRDMTGAPSFLTNTLEGSSSGAPRPPETHVPFQALTPPRSPTSLVSYSTRLNTLRALEHNWRHLSFPVPSHRVHVPFRTTYVYELSGGYFILGSDRTTLSPLHAASVPETGDGWASVDTMNKTAQLNFLRLPHFLRDADPKGSKGKDRVVDESNELAWTHLPLPFPIADFGIDASQDLLVLMQRHRLGRGYSFKFHLYTLECTPHPQASVTTLSAPSDPLLSWDWAIVHISGSTLVALLCSQRGPGNVLVWDWRKGIPLVEDTTPVFVHLHDISLIAPNILAAPCTEYGRIDILTFSTSPNTESTATPQQLKLRLLHRLMLPVQKPEAEDGRWAYGDINARLHPPPSSSVLLHRPKYSPGSTTLPFETDPEEGIVVYSMRLLHTRANVSDFTLVVHRSALINPRGSSKADLSRTIENAEELPPWSGMQERKPVEGEAGARSEERLELFNLDELTIPWKEWGPKHTRWIDGVRSARWICWVHGHRFVEIEEWEPPRRPLRRSPTQWDGTEESSLVEEGAKRVINKAIRAYKNKQAREASPDKDDDPSLMGTTVLEGEVVYMEEDGWEDVEDDSWDAYIEPNISPFLDTMAEEDQAELLDALRKVYEFPPPNPALYLRVWDFNPRAVRRALSEDREWSLPVASDALPTPDAAVDRGPVVVVERGGKPIEDEPGTYLPYILSTVKLDVPVDRATRRGVVLDGEHVILVKDAQTDNDTETTELVEVFSL